MSDIADAFSAASAAAWSARVLAAETIAVLSNSCLISCDQESLDLWWTAILVVMRVCCDDVEQPIKIMLLYMAIAIGVTIMILTNWSELKWNYVLFSLDQFISEY